jgi:arsenate reductase (thioredoxin)
MEQRLKKVLFLCTGNSCRSQMAEAIVNQRVEGWQAYSAGTKPAGYVHPKALLVLQEAGIHHSGASKHTDEFQDTHFDLVLTVCDSAAEECPIWLGKGKKMHHSFADPAQAQGSEEEVLSEFRRVRDEIMHTIPNLLKSTD